MASIVCGNGIEATRCEPQEGKQEKRKHRKTLSPNENAVDEASRTLHLFWLGDDFDETFNVYVVRRNKASNNKLDDSMCTS